MQVREANLQERKRVSFVKDLNRILEEQRECRWFATFGERMPGSDQSIQIPEDGAMALDRVREIQAVFEEEFPVLYIGTLDTYHACDCRKEIVDTAYRRVVTAWRKGNQQRVKEAVKLLRSLTTPEQLNNLLIRADGETGQEY